MCDIITDEEVEEFILKFFTKKEWAELGDIIKTRYRNMTKNYLSAPNDENFMPVPDYIRPTYSPSPNNIRPKSTHKARNVKPLKPVENVEPKAQRPKVPSRRNPKRNVAEINYFEPEEPGEDRYVFCDNCEEEYLDYCSKCGMLKTLRDFPVPLGTEDRAKKTAPKYVLEVRPSSIHGLGVFAIMNVRKGIQMGPYQGKITRINSTNGYCWKLRDGRLIDAADETRSNWLRYVNCARNFAEQNVVAFQYNGELYYRTCKDIKKGEELLVYYGQTFAEVLGINTKKYFQPNEEKIDNDYYCCEYCKIGLSTVEYRDTHEKYCRFRPNRMVLYGKENNFVCQYCRCVLTKEEFLKKHEIYCRQNPKWSNKLSEKEKKFQCSHCGKKFRNKYKLVEHEVIHNKEEAKKFACQKCSYKTIRLRNLCQHVRTHELGKRLKCPSCQKGFNKKSGFDSHILNNHTNLRHLVTSKVHGCQECHYETIQSSSLKHHLSVHDPTVSKKFNCGHCNYATIKKSNLKTHLLRHSPTKQPYVCRTCDQKFVSKHELDSHILANHKENDDLVKSISNKIHSCAICNYRTIYITGLKHHLYSAHKIKNSNTKLYVCRECNKDFVHKQMLDGHILRHHNQNAELMKSITSKTYSCRHCNFKTVLKTDFTRHVATHGKKNL